MMLKFRSARHPQSIRIFYVWRPTRPTPVVFRGHIGQPGDCGGHADPLQGAVSRSLLHPGQPRALAHDRPAAVQGIKGAHHPTTRHNLFTMLGRRFEDRAKSIPLIVKINLHHLDNLYNFDNRDKMIFLSNQETKWFDKIEFFARAWIWTYSVKSSSKRSEKVGTILLFKLKNQKNIDSQRFKKYKASSATITIVLEAENTPPTKRRVSSQQLTDWQPAFFPSPAPPHRPP